MPKVRTFVIAGGVIVEVVANDDYSVTVTVTEGSSRRTYASLDDFLHMEMGTFQSVYPQMDQAQDPEWRSNATSALTAISRAYPPPVLTGTLGEDALFAAGADPLAVVAFYSDVQLRPGQVTTNTLASLRASVQQIDAARGTVMRTLDNASAASAQALASRTGKRRAALQRFSTLMARVPQEVSNVRQQEAALSAQIHALKRQAQMQRWAVTDKQPHDPTSKTYRVKIKKGKFRDYVYFSQHRHSIPFFLEGHAAASPDSKPLNTLTILTEGDLIRSFDEFVLRTYVPFLNEHHVDQVVAFHEIYAPPAGAPRFTADKYYADQGMHCTPVATPGIAFTLAAEEHAFFVVMLHYVQQPTAQISAPHLATLTRGLDAAQATTAFGQLAAAYGKLIEILSYLPNRARPADRTTLAGHIRGVKERLHL